MKRFEIFEHAVVTGTGKNDIFLFEIFQTIGSMIHMQGRKNIFLHEIAVRLARYDLDDARHRIQPEHGTVHLRGSGLEIQPHARVTIYR